LEKWRQGGDTSDDEWESADGVYSLASRLADTANVTLTMPRLVGGQTCRNNTVAKHCIGVLQTSNLVPFLGLHMHDKFLTHQLTLLKLVVMVPSVVQ